MNTFVSPDTGKTYEITHEAKWYNDYSNSGTVVKKWYTQWNILENGKRVRFVFDEKKIAEMVHFHEFGDGWTTSPRD